MSIRYLEQFASCRRPGDVSQEGGKADHRVNGLLARMVVGVLYLFAVVVTPLPALAAYPDKPITIIVPYAAGSEGDRYARLMTDLMKTHFKEATLVVENRPGDSGAQGALAVKQSPADGYTLLAGRIASQAVAPSLKPAIPYRWNDFSFIGLLEVEPFICAVRADSPYRDARALIGAIRKAPGSFKYSHAGQGTLLNLAAKYLLKLGGLNRDAALAVGMNTTAEATAALVSGEVDFVCNSTATLLEPIRSGKVRPLFSTSAGRIEQLPDLKNARESGFPNMGHLLGWTVLAGPPKLPVAVVTRWKTALADMAKNPEWLAGLEARGAVQMIGTSRDREAFLKEQATFYEQLILSLGLRE